MDYCSEDTAMIYHSVEEAVEYVRSPDFSKTKKMQRVLREKIGDRKSNMQKFVEVIK